MVWSYLVNCEFVVEVFDYEVLETVVLFESAFTATVEHDDVGGSCI